MLTAVLTNHIWSTRKAEALNGFKLMQAEIIGGGSESGKKSLLLTSSVLGLETVSSSPQAPLPDVC